MGYVKALEVLPDDIIEVIQNYVEGELIYIPKRNKENWGANTDTKATLRKRNNAIYVDFQQGLSISSLSKKYFLSEKSIFRIIKQIRSQE